MAGQGSFASDVMFEGNASFLLDQKQFADESMFLRNGEKIC